MCVCERVCGLCVCVCVWCGVVCGVCGVCESSVACVCVMLCTCQCPQVESEIRLMRTERSTVPPGAQQQAENLFTKQVKATE